ncbi:thiamine biosynthesis lipoprotein [Paracoccus halophilus]|uniref:FAD:protein FMN transferase n=1 Tax=Paracoccus halophilus TaxID=376733 RepID=A0A099F7U7_9RHOB|nr:FAD:protein FMN transferase [Paracoccus halophilus]KGJ06524.1 thiamine biosynthesis protein ApbE [Paracoccus halophilus]SFA37843.1 thiamine biosynthesis lipoprotein [Paracoccus halophilus]
MVRAALLGLALLLAACKSEPARLELAGQTMGTTYSIVALDLEAKLDPDRVQAAVEATLERVNAGMSNWDPASEISRFNAQDSTDPVGISGELAEVMAAADRVHRLSEGQFDVTLGPLIELWGFGSRTPDTPQPDDRAIAAAMALVGQDRMLVLDAGGSPATLAKTQPGVDVYLAAIAKGYGVDAVAVTLRDLGLSDYLVEIGGEVVAAGRNPEGAPWRIGIERPDTAGRSVQQVVGLSDMGMATSGDYRNYFERDGVRYSHIIDARTGRPVSHATASVTVLAESAMMADAWATALLALGRERGMRIAEAQDLAVLFIARDAQAGDNGFVTTTSARFRDLQAGR